MIDEVDETNSGDLHQPRPQPTPAPEPLVEAPEGWGTATVTWYPSDAVEGEGHSIDIDALETAKP